MTGLVNSTPCPHCNRRAALMAGCNVPRGLDDQIYLVCWGCGVSAPVSTLEWAQFQRPRQARRLTNFAKAASRKAGHPSLF